MPSPRVLLRTLVLIALALAAAAFAFSLLPGLVVYRDGAVPETRAVVEHSNWLLGVLVVYLAPGLVIWRAPRIGFALMWSLWTIALTVLVVVATFDLGEVRAVVLWPSLAFGYAVSALAILVIAVVPAACGVFWVVTHGRASRPVLPVARVVKRTLVA